MGLYPRVLVVEDDPIVLLTFTLELQGGGVEVLGALSFAEAKGIVLAARGPFAVAVIELRPGSDVEAMALVRDVRALDPQTPAIFTVDALSRAALPAGVALQDVLTKPAAPRALSERVRSLLA